MKRVQWKWFKRAGVLALGLMLRLPFMHGEPPKLKKVSSSGVASFYADKFNGHRTASGERFNNQELTAAHRTLPLGTVVKVTNVQNGKTVFVRITDRLARTNHRIIDLTQRAARELGFLHKGVAHVSVEVLKGGDLANTFKSTWLRPFNWSNA